MMLSGYLYSVLSKARARFGAEVFEAFFRRSIDLCREAGLLEEGPVYVDSTLIRLRPPSTLWCVWMTCCSRRCR